MQSIDLKTLSFNSVWLKQQALYLVCVVAITCALASLLAAPDWHTNAVSLGGCLLAGVAVVIAVKTFRTWRDNKLRFWATTAFWVVEWALILLIRLNAGLL